MTISEIAARHILCEWCSEYSAAYAIDSDHDVFAVCEQCCENFVDYCEA